MATLLANITLNFHGTHTTADAVFGATTKTFQKLINFALTSGTTSGKADVPLFKPGQTGSDGGVNFDLAGTSEQDSFGTDIGMAGGVCIFLLVNNSIVTGEFLDIDGNFIDTYLGGTADSKLRVHPGSSSGVPGFILIAAPQDDIAVSGGSSDIITVTAASGKTPDYDLAVVGRSA